MEKQIYTRKCPTCSVEITYNNKYVKNRSERKQKLCASCASKTRGCSGPNHYMYGKKFDEKSKEKMVATKKANPRKYTREDKIRLSKAYSGPNNPMYGKTVYEVWLEKYGKEEADKRLLLRKKRGSGKNHANYGKISSYNFGYGHSGWYKGNFFRSLKELSFIVDYLEKNNLKWKSCENCSIRIEYVLPNGNDRTYIPDFIIENKRIVEIKPKKEMNDPIVLLKTKAAQKYCLDNNLEFEILDFPIISRGKIRILENKGLLKFTEKTQERMDKCKGEHTRYY